MDKNVVDFEDYNIKVDLSEIDHMNREQIRQCMEKINEIKTLLDNK